MSRREGEAAKKVPGKGERGHRPGEPVVEEEGKVRVAFATTLREATIRPGKPAKYYFDASERYIKGIRTRAPGTDRLFPPKNRRALARECLRIANLGEGEPGSSADFGWLARAALLDGPDRHLVTSSQLTRGIVYCLMQARPLLQGDPGEKHLGEARPWLEAASRFSLELDRESARAPIPFPTRDRRQYSRHYYRMAGARFDMMRFEEANQLYSLVLDLDPTFTSARFNRALTLAILKHNLEAKVEICNLVASEGWAADAAYLMGFVAENEGRMEAAVQLYAKAIGEGNYANAWSRLEALIKRRHKLKDEGAATDGKEPSVVFSEDPGLAAGAPAMVKCMSCARDIKREFLVCPYCGGISQPDTPKTPQGAAKKTPEEPSLPSAEEVARRYGGGLGTSSGDSHRPADIQIAWLEEALRLLVPPGADVRKRSELAVACMELDRMDEAKGLLEGLTREHPTVIGYRTALLRTLHRLKDWKGVLRLCDAVPENQEVLRFRITALLGLGRRDEARPLIARLPLETATQCEEAARFTIAVRDHAAADQLLDRAITIDSTLNSAHLLKELLSGNPVVKSPRSTLSRFEGIEPVLDLLVQRVVAPLLVPENYYAYDIADFQVLLAGPPGCGKTSVARALAKEASASFEYLRFDRVGDLYYGETEKAVHQLFLRARRAAVSERVILFIDEVDSFASTRRTREERNERRLFTQIMTELSELSEHLRHETLNMRVIGATNRPFDLDPAMIRTGRLGMPVYLGPPNAQARRRLIQQHLGGLPQHGSFDLDLATRETEWYSMSDVQGLLSDLLFEERSSDLMRREWKLTNERLLTEIRKRPPSVLGWFRQVDRLIKEGEIEATDLGRGFEQDYHRFTQWQSHATTTTANPPPGRRDRMFA